MADIIQLLPDSIANQIAAGEVIQRPASAVKELMENAVDAKATEIKLVIKDAGKTLIQTIDNGIGMSETDARMCFERHATSKIKKAEDLYALTSMGFRGEAMASIVAVSQCELKTKKEDEELGTKINIEGSIIKSQEADGGANGTSISIKNLFFNVPARRKFLKSDPVETRHITEEFQRVALANPDIAFSMHHNDNELFNLQKGTFRQRIVGIFGKNFNQKLVPIEEETNIVSISGFIAKPEAAKKTRGEQYLFVNNRFIKSPYLHNAIQNAFSELIPSGHHPSYFLNLTLDPGSIDINIHPTKTEIKFVDEKAIYAILRSATKQSIGMYNISPSLDFDQEQSLNIPSSPDRPIRPPEIKVNPNFNPFEKEKENFLSSSTSGYSKPELTPVQTSNQENWSDIYEGIDKHVPETMVETEGEQQMISSDWGSDEKPVHQLHGKYIFSQIKSGVILVHQKRAHERILFEQYLKQIDSLQQGNSQQLLFPETIEFSPKDFQLVKEIEPEIKALGFDFAEFGKDCIIVHGVPTDTVSDNSKELLEGILEHYKLNESELKIDKRTNIAQSLATKASIKVGKKMKPEEMSNMIDQLFACSMPSVSPSGQPTVITLTLEELDSKFES